MYKIEAFLRPSSLEEVQKSLGELGIAGMSVTEVRGFGRQRGHREVYRGAEYSTSFVPKVRIETVVDDAVVPKAVEAISAAAKTDAIGDGKIFTLDVPSALRIRTGETDETAL